jgi:hypothetical protein
MFRAQIKEIVRNEKLLDETEGSIPCLFMPYLMGSSKILIYFHGNAEDIGLSMELLVFIRDMLKVSNCDGLQYDRSMCLQWSIQATAFTTETQRQTR